MMYLWWSLCTLYLLACQVRATVGSFLNWTETDDVPLVEFMYLVFTRMSGQLLQMIQVLPVVFVWCLWSADQLLLFVDWTETDFCVLLWPWGYKWHICNSWNLSGLWNCVKVNVAALGSLSLILCRSPLGFHGCKTSLHLKTCVAHALRVSYVTLEVWMPAYTRLSIKLAMTEPLTV